MEPQSTQIKKMRKHKTEEMYFGPRSPGGGRRSMGEGGFQMCPGPLVVFIYIYIYIYNGSSFSPLPRQCWQYLFTAVVDPGRWRSARQHQTALPCTMHVLVQAFSWPFWHFSQCKRPRKRPFRHHTMSV